MTTTNLSITGMGCSGCADTVENALQSVQGVQEVKVDLENASALVVYDETATGLKELSEAVSKAGYGVNP